MEVDILQKPANTGLFGTAEIMIKTKNLTNLIHQPMRFRPKPCRGHFYLTATNQPSGITRVREQLFLILEYIVL